MKMKTCTKCKLPKDLKNFAINKTNKKDGRRSICKDCINTAQKIRWATVDPAVKAAKYEQSNQWRIDNPDKFFGPEGFLRRSRLRTKYGLSLEDWNLKFALQDNSCESCYTKDFNGVGPVIDHDHACCPGKKTCGKCVRGIICHQCNVVIGFVENGWDVEIPHIIRYLKIYS